MPMRLHAATLLVLAGLLAACTSYMPGQDAAADSAAPLADPAALAGDTLTHDDPGQRGEGPLEPFAVGASPEWRWGFRPRRGGTAIAPRFAYANGFHGGLAAVRVPTGANRDRHPWGYVDTTGRLAIPARFEGAGDFVGGRALVLLDDDLVFIDRAGQVVGRFVDRTGDPLALRTALAAECSPCSFFRLGELLGPAGRRLHVAVNPDGGETTFSITVIPLAHGAAHITEGALDSAEEILRLPGLAFEEGQALALRAIDTRQFTQRMGGSAPGETTFDVVDEDDGLVSELRVRRRNGVVELVFSYGS